MTKLGVFISSRMSNGELDEDRLVARDAINALGDTFHAFAFESIPESRRVWASDAEYRIGKSQVFVLLVASTLSPRVVDELRFAQRLGLSCVILVKQGTDRRLELSDFLSHCHCPVYPYGSAPGSLAAVLESILLARAGWNPAAEVVISLGQQAWSAIIESLARERDRVFELSPRKFEELIAELVEKSGYKVELTPTSRDGGRDIIAVRTCDLIFPDRHLIEAKLWTPPRKVGRPVIDAIYGVGARERCNGVMVVTPSGFSRDACESVSAFGLDQYVRLVDGDELPFWYHEYLLRLQGGATRERR